MLTFTHDNASRLTSVANSAGESIVYTRNKLGGATKIQVKNGATIVAERNQAFDELNRQIRAVGASSQTWTFGYDKTGNTVSVKDPRDAIWGASFDALNRLASESDPESATVALARNGVDDVTAYTDPRGLTTTYVRNGFGEVIRQTSPDSGVTDYVYDPRGLVTQLTDARGVVMDFTYDAAGRMTSKTYNGGATDRILVTWDGVASGNKGRGRLTRVTDPGGASDFRYDARGNVLSETRTISGTVYATAYTWDLADRLASITYPSGRVVTYQRDALGRVTGVTTRANASAPVQTLASGVAWRPMAGYASSASGPQGPDLDWGLAARNAVPVTDGSGMNAGTAAQIASLPHAGALTQDVLQTLTYGNGYTYWKNFTQDNELYQSIVEDSSATVMNAGLVRSDGTNVTQIWDALNASETQYFAYSPASRLSGAWGAYGTHAWTYDANGNRRTETKNGVATTWAYPTTSNRLTSVTQGSTTLRSFTYHNDGAIKRDTRSGMIHDFATNRAGRIGAFSKAGVAQSSYAYDAFNRLRVRTLTSATATPGTTHYVWDIFGHIVAEHVVGAGMAREYVWLGDTPLAVVDAAAGLYYVHVDHLDRPALMTDASKAVVWRASYEPFGAVRSITGPASLDLRFPGQWFQLEAGLAYNWNRHYDPTLGRYTQPDPLGFVDGPNVYGYVNGNPVLYADPSGEYVWIIFGAALGAGAEALNQYMECGEVYNLKSILVQGAVGGAASVMGGLGAINALGLGGRTAYGAYNGAKFGAIGAGLAGGGLASGGVGGAIGGAVGASVEGFLPAGYGIGRALGGLADAIASTGASNALSGGGNECKCKN